MLFPVFKPKPHDFVTVVRIGDSFRMQVNCCGRQMAFNAIDHGERYAVESATKWALDHKC